MLGIIVWTHLRNADHSSLHYPWAPMSLTALAVQAIATPGTTNARSVFKVVIGVTALVVAMVWATSGYAPATRASAGTSSTIAEVFGSDDAIGAALRDVVSEATALPSEKVPQ